MVDGEYGGEMSFNPSSGVAEARTIAQKHGDDIVIVLRIKLDEEMAYASYGRTKSLCSLAKMLADALHDRTYGFLEEIEKKIEGVAELIPKMIDGE